MLAACKSGGQMSQFLCTALLVNIHIHAEDAWALCNPDLKIRSVRYVSMHKAAEYSIRHQEWPKFHLYNHSTLWTLKNLNSYRKGAEFSPFGDELHQHIKPSNKVTLTALALWEAWFNSQNLHKNLLLPSTSTTRKSEKHRGPNWWATTISLSHCTKSK